MRGGPKRCSCPHSQLCNPHRVKPALTHSWQVLLPRFGLPSDPDYDPAEDWLDDNKGLPYMDFPNFFDAMFEVCGDCVCVCCG